MHSFDHKGLSSHHVEVIMEVEPSLQTTDLSHWKLRNNISQFIQSSLMQVSRSYGE